MEGLATKEQGAKEHLPKLFLAFCRRTMQKKCQKAEVAFM